MIVIIYSITLADDLASGCRAYEKRRALLLELLLRRVERDTRGRVRENLPHVWSVVRRAEEGAEGRSSANVRDIAKRWPQHGPEVVYEAGEASRVTVAAVDNGVAALARNVVAS